MMNHPTGTRASAHRFRVPLVAAAVFILAGLIAPVAASAAGSAGAAHPRTGGSLALLAVGTGNASSDPIQPVGSNTDIVGDQLPYQNLLSFNSKTGQIEPLLATSYAYNATHTTLTLHLRHGVTFQDGTPFNAAAVVYNLERVAAPASGSECVPYFGVISSIAATSPYTVVLTYNATYSVMPDILADEPCSMMASPTAIQQLGGQAFAQHPVGTSPWAYSSGTTTTSMTFTRYKRAWQKGYLNSITVGFIGDDQSAIDAVETNTAQVFSAGADLGDVAVVKALHSKSLYMVKTPLEAILNIRLEAAKAPFNNLQARRAVAQGLNTPLIARELYGNTETASQSNVAPISWAFDGFHVHGFPRYSPAEAAADVASLPGGTLNFTFNIENIPGAIQLAEAVQAELDAIPGITVTLNPLNIATLLSAQRAGTYQASIGGFGGSAVLPDPDFAYYRNYYSKSSNNEDGFSDPVFDNLVLEARQIFSQPQRKKLYEQAQERLAELLPIIPLFNNPVLYIVNSKVHDFPAVDTSTPDQSLAQVWMS